MDASVEVPPIVLPFYHLCPTISVQPMYTRPRSIRAAYHFSQIIAPESLVHTMVNLIYSCRERLRL